MDSLPTLLNPIPVAFLTDFVRELQKNRIEGSLKAAADSLVRDVMFRGSLEEAVETRIELATRFREGEPTTEDDLKQERLTELEDPITNVLNGVVDGIMKGETLTPHHDKIRKYITNQQDRSELIANLLVTKDYRRLVSFLQARDILERDLLEATLRADLNISEKMALFQMVTEITSKLENKVQAGASNVSDFIGLMTKVDYTLQEDETQLKLKLKKTSPAGREIVRRVMHKLAKTAREKEKPAA